MYFHIVRYVRMTKGIVEIFGFISLSAEAVFTLSENKMNTVKCINIL
jgi:hypothetical protein